VTRLERMLSVSVTTSSLTSSPPPAATAEDGSRNHQAPKSPASPAFSTSSTFEGASSPVLPPLPAPPISQRALELLKTPPRTDGSQYYTASWGSPYEQPIATSTGQHPHTASSEHSEDSPVRHLEFHTPFLRPAPNFTRSQTDPDYVSQDGLISAAVLAKRARRPAQGLTEDWIRQHTGGESAENNAWLSDDPEDSEHSSLRSSVSGEGSEWPGQERDPRTPTLKRFLETREKLRDVFAIPRRRNSTATLKQEDFSDSILHTMSTADENALTSQMGNENSTQGKEEGESGPKSKELPEWSPAPMPTTQAVPVVSTPTPGPPRLRKKVPWKSKNITINLPWDDERGHVGKAPLPMTGQEVDDMMVNWKGKGYSTAGFDLGETFSVDSEGSLGQSRGIWPDAADVLQERAKRSFKVSIPDRRGKPYLNFKSILGG
jgi:hypothetical protein